MRCNENEKHNGADDYVVLPARPRIFPQHKALEGVHNFSLADALLGASSDTALIFIDRCGSLAALRDGPHHQGLAAASVPGREHTGQRCEAVLLVGSDIATPVQPHI